MIPLIPVLTERDICIDQEQIINLVHEWGVVVFESSGDVHLGQPVEELEYVDSPDVAYAPVVWIHGVPFSGTFSVHSEQITYAWPPPDRAFAGSAEWDIAGINNTAEEQTPVPAGMPFFWGVDFFREVPSLVLKSPSGWQSNFLYYECSVEPGLADVFFERLNTNGALFTTEVSQGLYFQDGDQYLIEISAGRLIPLNMTVNPEPAVETFYRWAGSGLKSSEIDALWETWSPILAEEGTGWLVFPIPEEYYGMISSIELETDSGGQVEYERFYLGAIRINQL